MAYRFEKNGQDTDIVISGWENGVARSPLSGIANMQNVNIATENKEVMNSYGRVAQSTLNTSATGTLTFLDSSHLTFSIGGNSTQLKGMWITVTGSSNTGQLPNATYYVVMSSGPGVQLSSYYGSTAITGYTAGLTASFTLVRNMTKPITSATEQYTVSGVLYYRYYILDSQGLVWVYDSANEGVGLAISPDYMSWFLPDYSITYYTGPPVNSNPTGIAVLNGWLHVFAGNTIYVKPTISLGNSTSTTTNWTAFSAGQMTSSYTNADPHFAYTSHQGTLLYTDGNYIGSIFPNSSLLSGTANVQSYGSYTGSATVGTVTQIYSGSNPISAAPTPRIPAVFFHALTAGAANPTALTLGTIYYIEFNKSTGAFTVFTTVSDNTALDVTTGAVGTQYFNTYYPASYGGNATVTFTPQALNLPAFETATSIAEVGNLVIIGGKENVLYPWNQVDLTPSDLIFLPENNTTFLLAVNNMVYAFVGSKGNIYVTNGSTATLVISVPDYCAGIAGNAQSYVEPYFVWGGVAYARGKIYFSLQDQVAAVSPFAAKTGNCGGVWSFTPSQNFFYGQDTGLALKLENANSYDTYNGAASVIVTSQNQAGRGTQYWTGWYDGLSSVKYGIDFTDTSPNPNTPAVIETDLIATGTLLNKETFKQIEYKLSTPLVSGESIAISYRLNSTEAWTSCGSIISENTFGIGDLSGYIPVNFQRGQWLQLQITLTPTTGTVTNSFVRLTELRIR